MLRNDRVIALEEHYLDETLADYLGRPTNKRLEKALLDFAEIRLGEMNQVGIDLQVLSHAPPALQGVLSNDAQGLARGVNDRLHAIVKLNPERFAAFATLPTSNPAAAATELRRTIETLGFKGAMVHGPTNGLFLDDPRFWPIFEAAQALDVPIYLHPADPMPSVREAYFGNMAVTHPMFLRAAWGFTIETATHAMRLVLGGVFDKYPDLKIILGHLGETIPFLVRRIDEALSRDTPMKDFRDRFLRHFYITTSGFFADAPLTCCISEMGIDRIMFSVDWPFASGVAGMEWIDKFEMEPASRSKLLHGNAERLLAL